MLLKETEMIRRATIEDYDAVISILPGKDYDGDYLPDYFHMLMNNQSIKAYVYILDGKITGFQIVYLVDGGTTGVMRSGRIRKDTQGKGVLRKLGEFIMEKNPSLTHVVFATGTNVPTIFQNIRNGEYQFVAKRVCLYYQTNKHSLIEH
ncbi:histidine N-acetyltransferase-like [Mytilus galloprovincialis]|uniref:histidine N-acetyltransferase-like n=1 Tax=Mytilus galloprovincialis TaxID=29158 RepID=UPI003F7C528D